MMKATLKRFNSLEELSIKFGKKINDYLSCFLYIMYNLHKLRYHDRIMETP